jgi:hypothetical protein
MARSTRMALMTLFVVVSLALSACSLLGESAGGPEAAVRACLDAINARDKDKFLSFWAPDSLGPASSRYDFYATFGRKFPTVKSISAQDVKGNPTLKDVTVQVVKESQIGKIDKTLKFSLRSQDGRWLVFYEG